MKFCCLTFCMCGSCASNAGSGATGKPLSLQCSISFMPSGRFSALCTWGGLLCLFHSLRGSCFFLQWKRHDSREYLSIQFGAESWNVFNRFYDQRSFHTGSKVQMIGQQIFSIHTSPGEQRMFLIWAADPDHYHPLKPKHIIINEKAIRCITIGMF